MERCKRLIKISILGIIVNVILVSFKMIVGLIANSIAIILDAVNNLSDAISSIITIIGTKLSNKKPNKKHPYGYGRVEYLTSTIIALIVLVAGITSFRESLDKIIHPEVAEYSIISLIIIIVAVLVKFFFGRYVKKEGEKLSSSSLVASGTDAISDSVLSFSTFIAALISLLFHISLEGYLGIIISFFILKTAFEILKDTVNDMIGVRADSELTRSLKNKLLKYKEVKGVYDLTLHNYGPNKIIATAHIEIDDMMKAYEIHRLSRKITLDIYNEYSIILTVGIYASNDRNEYKEIKRYLQKVIKKYQTIQEMHGFYVDDENKFISCDLIFNFEEENIDKIISKIKEEINKKYLNYHFDIIIDTDFSD